MSENRIRTKQIKFRASRDEYAMLVELSEHYGVSAADYMRLAIRSDFDAIVLVTGRSAQPRRARKLRRRGRQAP
jgi:hypothetical protein